jgi:2-amino-4-hydroxy-6-hydroxymethyldihydropteridine diphosphokinase
VALAIAAGADIVRVHDVAEMAQVARMADAVVRGWPPAERRVWLGLGGNTGDRVATLRRALDGLEAGGVVVQLVSALYETLPWGITDQPRFANAALQGRTALAPLELLALAKRLEAEAGRDFGAPRTSARPLDIDLLLIEGVQVEDERLTVPHVHLHERAFVLVPLAEIAPELRHPRLGRTMRDLREGVAADGVEPLAAPGWWGGAR